MYLASKNSTSLVLSNKLEKVNFGSECSRLILMATHYCASGRIVYSMNVAQYYISGSRFGSDSRKVDKDLSEIESMHRWGKKVRLSPEHFERQNQNYLAAWRHLSRVKTI